MKNPQRVAELLNELKAECEYRFEFDALASLRNVICAPLPTVEIIDERHQRFCGKKYTKNKISEHYFRGKREPLHRDVWQHFFGDVPDGYVVHHSDENKDNNDISNLRLMTREAHTRYHNTGVCRLVKKTFICEWCGKEYEAFDVGKNKFCSHNCATRHCQNTHRKRKICPICGKEFFTTTAKTKYCSDACAGQAYTAAHNETRTCPVCQKEFSVPKSSKNIYCSRSCSGKARSKQMERTCVICGKTFTTSPSENCRACSPECGFKLQSQTKNANSKRLKRICPICGKEFETYVSQSLKTCSAECGRELRKRTMRENSK